jgi:glycerophosphoryl diester phosphodiesterase
MSRLLDTWYDVFAHARLGRILRSALDYDLAYKAIGAIVLPPLTAWVLQRLINVSGGVSVTNEAIAGFLLSPTGFAFVLVAATLTLTSFYTEQAGLMHIAAAAGRGKLTHWQDALATALRALPRLLHLALWQTGILVLWLLPLAAVAAATYLNLLGDHDINFYLTQRPPAFLAAVAIGAVLGLVAATVLLYFGTAWALAIPLCLYERLRGRAALRRSAELTRGHRWRAFRVVVLNLLLALALSTLVLWMADAGVGALLRLVTGVDALAAATALAVVLLIAVAALTSYFLMTILAGSIIHLYLQVQRP